MRTHGRADRQFAAGVVAAALLLTAGCSSSKGKASDAIPTTTAPSALALWLDSLSPPLEGFVFAQNDFVSSLLVEDLAPQKAAAVKAAAAAKTFSDALKAAPTAPGAVKQVQKAESLLDQLAQLGTGLQTCATNCEDLLIQFTTIFTDATAATNELQNTARPPAKPGTTVPIPNNTVTTAGGGTATTAETVPGAGQTPSSVPDDDLGPTIDTVPPTPELTAWVNKYGKHAINASQALANLAGAIESTDFAVVESACSAFVSAVNVVDSDPIAPNRQVATALAAAMSHTRNAYAVCADDPSVRDTDAEDAIRDSLYGMGAAMPGYAELIY